MTKEATNSFINMLYSKLLKLLNDKEYSEIEKIYQNNKNTIDKNEDLLTIYGMALANQNKYELALIPFRKAHSISTKVRNIENLAFALHKNKKFAEASELYMKLSTFWKNVKIKNHTKIERDQGFLIFGLQRSGSNVLSEILKRSCSSIKNNFFQINDRRFDVIWKHSIYVPTINIDCPTFVIFKNPYKWVESICLRNHRDILSRQVKYPIDEREGLSNNYLFGKNKFNLQNLGKLYNHFFESWIINKSENIKQKIIIKYEDLLDKEKRDSFMKEISKKLNINFNMNVDPISLIGQVYQSENFSEKNLKYYKEEENLSLSEENLSIFNSNLNNLIFDMLEYKKINKKN